MLGEFCIYVYEYKNEMHLYNCERFSKVISYLYIFNNSGKLLRNVNEKQEMSCELKLYIFIHMIRFCTSCKQSYGLEFFTVVET